MTLPEGVEPSEPTPAPEAVTEEPVATEPASSDAAVTEEAETPEEAASDAALRTWAKDNGIEGVPASGKLSAAWREQITAAMAAALDPKDEASASATPFESSTSVETTTEEATTGSSGEEISAPTEPVKPEFEPTEYRSVFKAPNTFVTSQTYTA